MLSIKNLVFKKWLVKKLVDYYVELYTIEEIIFINVVKLKLPTIMRIYLVVNTSQVIKYRKSVKEKKVKKPKLINMSFYHVMETACIWPITLLYISLCYNLKLGLDYNLSKNLRKNERDDQLVKHKDIGLYLLLYISIDYEK